MVKKIFFGCIFLLFLTALTACGKKEEGKTGAQPVQPPPVSMPESHSGTPPTGLAIPQGEITINVPDTVKGKWRAVTLVVEDKANKSSRDHAVSLGGELAIPDSKLVIKVGDFLPSFAMDGATITSSSNEQNNPAVQVSIKEDGKEIFKGWLFSKFPTIHPFQHDRFGIILKGGVAS